MLRNTNTRYGWAAIVLHWLIAALFIGQFTFGLVMVRMTSQRTSFELIQLDAPINLAKSGVL